MIKKIGIRDVKTLMYATAVPTYPLLYRKVIQ